MLRSDGLALARVGADEVVAKAGLAELRLRGTGITAVVEEVARLADGTRDEAGIVAAFDEAEREAVTRIVASLTARGMLSDAVAGQDDPSDTFWHSVRALAPTGPADLARARVLMLGAGDLAAAVAVSLASCGVEHIAMRPGPPTPGSTPGLPAGQGSAGPETTDLWCAVADDGPDSLVAAAEAALAVGAILLPVWMEDLVGHVGPLTHPHDTACLRCYLARIESNDPQRVVHALLRADGPAASAGHLPTMREAIAAVAATEAVKHLTGLPSSCTGAVIDLSLVPFRAHVRRVLKHPRCPACSGLATQGPPVVSHVPQMSE